jgi:hypothetical protein
MTRRPWSNSHSQSNQFSRRAIDSFVPKYLDIAATGDKYNAKIRK